MRAPSSGPARRARRPRAPTADRALPARARHPAPRLAVALRRRPRSRRVRHLAGRAVRAAACRSSLHRLPRELHALHGASHRVPLPRSRSLPRLQRRRGATRSTSRSTRRRSSGGSAPRSASCSRSPRFSCRRALAGSTAVLAAARRGRRRRRPRGHRRGAGLVRLSRRAGGCRAGMRDAAAYAIGYGAQTTAYALLVTDRYPDATPGRADPPPELPAHPVAVRVDDELARPRLLVLFRLPLVHPAPPLAHGLVGVRARRLDRSPGSSRSSSGACRGRSTGFSPPTSARWTHLIALPLRRRAAVPGLRRPRGRLPDRPADRGARAAAAARRALPARARAPRAPPRRRVRRRRARRRRARLAGGARDGPDAGRPSRSRRRGAALPGAGQRLPLPSHVALPGLVARARRARRAATPSRRPVVPA